MASPMAPPICCDVLKMPDARPASPESMFVVAISVTGTKVKPMPSAMITSPGKTSAKYVPCTGMPLRYTSPGGRHHHPDDRHEPDAELRDPDLRDSGSDHDAERHGQERKARLDRRVPEHEL